MLIRTAEYALWCVALLCISTVGWGRLQAHRAQAQALHAFDLVAQVARGGDFDTLANGIDSFDTSSWSTERIERFEDARQSSAVPAAAAVLNIPRIDLRVGVFNGSTDRLLDLGVGRVAGTAQFGETGHLAIAGHRDGFFRGLKEIRLGDELVVDHGFEKDTYLVTDISIVDPEDISVLAPTESKYLTLVTCYPFYFLGSAPQRYIVKARWQHPDSLHN